MNVANILAVRNYLRDEVADTEYDQGSILLCIVGHAATMVGVYDDFGDFSDCDDCDELIAWFAVYCGISRHCADEVWMGPRTAPRNDITRHDAVTMLQRLAYTGRVDWPNDDEKRE